MKLDFINLKKGAVIRIWCGSLLFFSGCSIFATRPLQDMYDMAAAVRSAREVQADVLTPELYRQAVENMQKARKEYRFKNFANAAELAKKARLLAEQAEFEAIRIGGNRVGVTDQEFTDGLEVPPPPIGLESAPPKPSTTPYNYPTPTGTPIDVYEERKKSEAPSPPGPNPGQPGPVQLGPIGPNSLPPIEPGIPPAPTKPY